MIPSHLIYVFEINLPATLELAPSNVRNLMKVLCIRGSAFDDSALQRTVAYDNISTHNRICFYLQCFPLNTSYLHQVISAQEHVSQVAVIIFILNISSLCMMPWWCYSFIGDPCIAGITN